jgi:hypothetical protein
MMATEGDKMLTFSVHEVNRLREELAKLRRELQATRWAMWWVIDAWEKGKPWGDGHGGLEATPTDVGLSLVREGREIEEELERKGLYELMSVEQQLLSRVQAP